MGGAMCHMGALALEGRGTWIFDRHGVFSIQAIFSSAAGFALHYSLLHRVGPPARTSRATLRRSSRTSPESSILGAPSNGGPSSLSSSASPPSCSSPGSGPRRRRRTSRAPCRAPSPRTRHPRGR